VSKARLVITAVLIEGRNQSQVARDYGVSQSWISRLIARYTPDGDAAFEPRSRRPHTSPTRLPQATIDLIIAPRMRIPLIETEPDEPSRVSCTLVALRVRGCGRGDPFVGRPE
jgi:hypothetical protein